MAVDLERAKDFLNSGGYSRNHNQDLIFPILWQEIITGNGRFKRFVYSKINMQCVNRFALCEWILHEEAKH